VYNTEIPRGWQTALPAAFLLLLLRIALPCPDRARVLATSKLSSEKRVEKKERSDETDGLNFGRKKGGPLIVRTI
jgi:hypothetical protein